MPFSFSRKKTITVKTANKVTKVESNLDVRPTGKFFKRMFKQLRFLMISLIATLGAAHLLMSPPTEVREAALMFAHEKSAAVSDCA